MPTNKNLFLFVVACAVVFGFLAAASAAFAASSEKVLYSFCPAGGNCADGAYPNSGVISDSAGNLYGTNLAGSGEYCVSYGVQCGTVFELISSNGKWTEKVLYSFCSASNCNDGDGPIGGLIFDKAGNLYGTTESGGTCYSAGTVFELTRHNGKWTEKVLHSFCPDSSDGSTPYTGLVLDGKGNLYGTTFYGGTGTGCSIGCGTVFGLMRSGGKWTEKVLHNFNNDGKDGYTPVASLAVDTAGNLYGTTAYGGAYNDGTVFELRNVNGKWTERVLHSFNGGDGANPEANVVFDNDGELYGTTENGGDSGCGGGCGTVFQLVPKNGAWREKVLYRFHNSPDGSHPLASLLRDKSGRLYSTTFWGGAFAVYGTVFELTPQDGKWTEKVLHSFNLNGQDGASPFNSGVVQDKAGNLYGTTGFGGTYCSPMGCGAVFEVTP
jgi:uncharacterized repeat protein (TIGR03803 family)